MKALRLADIIDIDSYERIRPDYRPRILEHKRVRRVPVGPLVSVVFEDRETLRYQILEMTRVERTTDPAKVQIEIDVYNDLVPGENELSATLFIEIPELDQIRTELDRLIGIDSSVAVIVDAGSENETQAPGRFDERQLEEDRISAVHYLRFSLNAEQVERFEAGARVSLRISHPRYQHEAELCSATRASLLRDLRDATPVLLDPEEMKCSPAAAGTALVETPSVQARKLLPVGSRSRVVVETKDRAASLIGADPELISELVRVAQQVARELHARTGSCRIRMDAAADAKGALRIEVSSPSAPNAEAREPSAETEPSAGMEPSAETEPSAEAEPSEGGRREPQTR